MENPLFQSLKHLISNVLRKVIRIVTHSENRVEIFNRKERFLCLKGLSDCNTLGWFSRTWSQVMSLFVYRYVRDNQISLAWQLTRIEPISVYKHCFCYSNMPTTRTNHQRGRLGGGGYTKEILSVSKLGRPELSSKENVWYLVFKNDSNCIEGKQLPTLSKQSFYSGTSIPGEWQNLLEVSLYRGPFPFT